MDFEVLKYTHDRNPNAHIHENYEILIALNNEGKFFVREKGYQLHFGMAIILPSFEIHRCFCHGSQDYERYIIHFTPETLQQISTRETDLVGLFNAAPLVQQIRDDTLAKLLGMLSYLVRPKTDGYGDDVERSIRFQNFILTMARLIHDEDGERAPALECGGRINEVLQYIHANYAGNISLETLSKKFFISKSRLSQTFKDATGFSVGDYIITYRVKRACTLLQSGMRVQDVGEMVGFRTSTHFIRTFKKRTGASPGKFSKEEDNFLETKLF